jgi:glycosyltransferase involved in cell wall biosynthesis
VERGRVVYVVTEWPYPSGGVKIIHRHVELLRAAGVDAVIWVRDPGFRFSWLDSTAPLVSGAELDLGPADLLVVPEVMVSPGLDPAPDARKIIFNQGHYLTYERYAASEEYPGWVSDPDMWVVSEESAAVLGRTEPRLTTRHIPNPVDLDLFRPARERRRRICWMPRRRPHEAALLERLLRNDKRSAGVELTAIDGRTEAEVAQLLGESSVFLSLGLFEGLGLPVVEALSAGCLVVGYPAGGGRELFAAPGTFEVPDSSPVQLADRALDAVHGIPEEESVRAAARAWVRERHAPEVTTAALLRAIDAASARPAAAAVATYPAQHMLAPVRGHAAE